MIKKLFGPINRWQFFVALLIVYSYCLYAGIFCDIQDPPFPRIYYCHLNNHLHIDYSHFIFLFLFYISIFKRLIDINNISKTLLLMLPIILLNTYMLTIHNYDILCIWGGWYIICLVFGLLIIRGKNYYPYDIKKYTLPYKSGCFIDYGNMYPAFGGNDTILVHMITPKTVLNRGDIVTNRNDNILRRIIGLPNETVEMRGKEIYINGKLFDDKYAFYSEKLEPIDFQNTFRLNSNQYLLIGDNRYYTKGGKYLTTDKENIELWKDIWSSISIYTVVTKEDLHEKAIGIQYQDYNENTKKLTHAGFAFAFKGKTFEHNYKRRSIYDRMFLKENS